MISKLKVHAITLMMSAALAVDQAMAMSWPGGAHGPDNGGGGHATAPELDGSGAIVAIAFLVSAALVLFNRSRNK